MSEGVHTMPLASRRIVGLILTKAQVRGYTRRTRSGGSVTVQPYSTTRPEGHGHPEGTGGLHQKIEHYIRTWPQWSPAEHRHMDRIVDEIMTHVKEGGGNKFVQEWTKRNLSHLFPKA